MNTSDCERIRPSLGAYALGALDPEEAAQVRKHLPHCPACQEELEGFSQITAALHHTVAPISPPEHLKGKLLAEIEGSRNRGLWDQIFDALSPRPKVWAGAALLLLILLNLGMILQVRELVERNRDLQAQARIGQTALALASYPGSRVIPISGDAVGGTFVYDPDLQSAVLYAWGLDPLARDQVYQAWLIEPDGSRVNGGLFSMEEGADFALHLIRSSKPLGDYQGFGVTVEPAGGSSGPTGPKVLGGDL